MGVPAAIPSLQRWKKAGKYKIFPYRQKLYLRASTLTPLAHPPLSADPIDYLLFFACLPLFVLRTPTVILILLIFWFSCVHLFYSGLKGTGPFDLF
jgi:hypothetical protein